MSNDDVKPKADQDPAETVYDGPVLEWTCHPVKRKPWVSVAVTFFITIVGLSIYYGTDSKWFAVFGVIVIVASLAKFYFPTSYRLTDEGFQIKTSTQTLKKLWSNFRSFYPDKNGVLISPFATPSRLENFRGAYLMFNRNRDEVLAFIKERIGKDAEPSKSTEAEEDQKS